jgi:hypothetical protein
MDYELLSDNEVLWLEVGPIGQYFSYIDTAWDKGVLYFYRDWLLLQPRSEARDSKINSLNSKLQAYACRQRS